MQEQGFGSHDNTEWWDMSVGANINLYQRTGKGKGQLMCLESEAHSLSEYSLNQA